MKKKTKTILICLICLLVAAGGVFLMLSRIQGMKYAKDELTYCSVSTGGGMLGGHSSLVLAKDDAGNATLTLSEKATHADRETTTVWNVDPSAFDGVREIVNEYDLYAASKRPYSKIQAMDADTTSVHFSYSKGSFGISSEQEMNRKMREGFWNVRDYLRTLIDGEGVTTLEPQTATLYLKSGYTLQFSVEAEFDGKLDDVLIIEREVSAYGDSGIVICSGETVDTSGALPIDSAAAGSIVYNSETEEIVILYRDLEFGQEVYLLAHYEGHIPSGAPLIAEMEGMYRLFLN